MDDIAADVAVFSCSLWRRAGADSLRIAREAVTRAEGETDASHAGFWRLALEQLEKRVSGGRCPLCLDCRSHGCLP